MNIIISRVRIIILAAMTLSTVVVFAWDLNFGPKNLRTDFHPKYRCEYRVYYNGRDTILRQDYLNIYSYDENMHLIKDEYYYIYPNDNNRLELRYTYTYEYDQSGRVTNRIYKYENDDYEDQYQQKYNDEGQTTYKKNIYRNVKTGEIKHEEEYYDYEYDDVVKNKVLAYKYKHVHRYPHYMYPYYIDSTTRAEKKSIVYRNGLGNVDSVYTWHYSQKGRWAWQFQEIDDITKYKEKSRLYVKYASNNKATEIKYMEREGSDIFNLSDKLYTEFKIEDLEWYKTNGQFFDLTNPYVPNGGLLHLDTSNLIRAGYASGYAENLKGEYKSLSSYHYDEILYTTDPKTGEITGIDFTKKSWTSPPYIKFPDNHGGYDTNTGNTSFQYDDFGEIIRYWESSKHPTVYYKIGKYDSHTGLPQEYEIYYCGPGDYFMPTEANYLIRFENPLESSVEEISADKHEPSSTQYFTLSGLPVSENQLTNGIYIKVTNGKAEKIKI